MALNFIFNQKTQMEFDKSNKVELHKEHQLKRS